MKGIQRVDSTIAAASSNHHPTAIQHTTRSTIKYNLTVKVGELTNRHKAHREAGNMRNRRDRDGIGGEVTNGGDIERGTVGNANSSGVRWWATTSKGGGIGGHMERCTRVQKPKRIGST